MQQLLYEEGLFFLTLTRTDNLTITSLELPEVQCVAKIKDDLDENSTFRERSD